MFDYILNHLTFEANDEDVLKYILYPYYFKQHKFAIIEYFDENAYFFHNFGDTKFFAESPLDLQVVRQFCSYDDATLQQFLRHWH
jgi:hypothetical protein